MRPVSAAMEPVRSMLFVPGDRPHLVDKAVASGADAIIFDLEDAVPAASKQAARHNLLALGDLPVPVFVRVNGGDTEWLWDDVVAVTQARAAGLVLPKAESSALLARLDGALTVGERLRGLPAGATALIPLIESALGVLRAHEMATSSERIACMQFGSGEQGDLVADLGCEWTPEGTALLTARAQVLMAARAAGVPQPMDAVFMDFRNLDALRVECQLAKRLGYVGKVAIHPAQIPVIHEVFTPSAEEVRRQQEIVDRFESALEEGSASIQVDGKMVDYAVARVARAVLGRAEAARRAEARAGASAP